MRYLAKMSLAVCLLISIQAYGQEDGDIKIEEMYYYEEVEVMEEPQEFAVVEDMPVFKGCEEQMNEREKEKCTQRIVIEHISNNVIYPPQAKEDGVAGTVFVRFVVSSEGAITKAVILRGVRKDLDAAAIAAVQSLPVLTAGKQRGKPVNVAYNIPVKFEL